MPVRFDQPFVGRILDWYKAKFPEQDSQVQTTPAFSRSNESMTTISLRLRDGCHGRQLPQYR